MAMLSVNTGSCLETKSAKPFEFQMNDGGGGGGVVSKETVVLRRWGSSIQKFGFINGVDNVS